MMIITLDIFNALIFNDGNDLQRRSFFYITEHKYILHNNPEHNETNLFLKFRIHDIFSFC
jgi:hypothetical protein